MAVAQLASYNPNMNGRLHTHTHTHTHIVTHIHTHIHTQTHTKSQFWYHLEWRPFLKLLWIPVTDLRI